VAAEESEVPPNSALIGATASATASVTAVTDSATARVTAATGGVTVESFSFSANDYVPSGFKSKI